MIINTIQIVGPCTGIPSFNYPLMNTVEVRLRAAGFSVTNPAKLYEQVTETNTQPTWTDMMRVCIYMLAQQDAIVRLPGWENSKGAKLESHIAQELGLQIFEWEAMEPHLNKQIKLDHDHR